MISQASAKIIFREMFITNENPYTIAVQMSLYNLPKDDSKINYVIDDIIEKNKSIVEEIRGGKDKAIGRLIGMVMKEFDGKMDAKEIRELLISKING